MRRSAAARPRAARWHRRAQLLPLGRGEALERLAVHALELVRLRGAHQVVVAGDRPTILRGELRRRRGAARAAPAGGPARAGVRRTVPGQRRHGRRRDAHARPPRGAPVPLIAAGAVVAARRGAVCGALRGVVPGEGIGGAAHEGAPVRAPARAGAARALLVQGLLGCADQTAERAHEGPSGGTRPGLRAGDESDGAASVPAGTSLDRAWERECSAGGDDPFVEAPSP